MAGFADPHAPLAPGADDLEIDGAFAPIETAPQDGRLIAGELADGERLLMRWRSREAALAEDGAEDQAEAPYWARWQTDTGVEPVRWAPTRRSLDDVPGKPRTS